MRTWDMMTWKEIDSIDRSSVVVILPTGSTEQHGERLPVGTDRFFAREWAIAVNAALPSSILLPPLNYGMARHHTAFPGTISLDASVYTLIIKNILESLAKHKFQKVLIVNGHGGNHDWIEQAIAEAKDKYPDLMASNPLMDIAMSEKFKTYTKKFKEDIVHAGAMEVSMLGAMNKFPVAEAKAVTVTPEGAKWGEGTASPDEWKSKFPQGQKGDQTNTNWDLGNEMNCLIIAGFLKAALSLF